MKQPPEYVIHEIPLTQLLAICACDGYLQGMQPAGETYEDKELTRTLEEIRRNKRGFDSNKSTWPE